MNKIKANYGGITTINFDCPTGADFEAMITLTVDIIMYCIVELRIKVKQGCRNALHWTSPTYFSLLYALLHTLFF